MTIVYLCHRCREELKISGFEAVNEVGRKCCIHCGSTKDDLHVIGEGEYNQFIKAKGAVWNFGPS